MARIRNGLEYHSLAEAARLLGVDRRVIRDEINAKRLPAVRHRPENKRAMWRIFTADLDAYRARALQQEGNHAAAERETGPGDGRAES